MIRRRWVMILVFALIGPPLAYGISRLLPNRYKSQTLVLIEPANVSDHFVQPVDIPNASQRIDSMSAANFEPRAPGTDDSPIRDGIQGTRTMPPWMNWSIDCKRRSR